MSKGGSRTLYLTLFHKGAEAPLEPRSRVGGSLCLLVPVTLVLLTLDTSTSFRSATGHPCGSKMACLLSVYCHIMTDHAITA